MFRRLSSVLSLDRAITNYYAYFLNYLSALTRKPSFRYINYLGDEYRRDQKNINFFLENIIFYGSIRPQDFIKIFILENFEFTIHEFPRNYNFLRRVLYGGAVNNRGLDYRGIYQPDYLKTCTLY
jgi:hypothetical protein